MKYNYIVIDMHTREVVHGSEHRSNAKRVRRDHNEAAGELRFIVAPGPDHPRMQYPCPTNPTS